MLTMPFLIMGALTVAAAALLFVLHSFLYVLAVALAVLLLLAAAASRWLERRSRRASTR